MEKDILILCLLNTVYVQNKTNLTFYVLTLREDLNVFVSWKLGPLVNFKELG